METRNPKEEEALTSPTASAPKKFAGKTTPAITDSSVQLLAVFRVELSGFGWT